MKIKCYLWLVFMNCFGGLYCGFVQSKIQSFGDVRLTHTAAIITASSPEGRATDKQA